MKRNYLTKKLFSFLALLVMASFSFAQTNIYTETFDDTLNFVNVPDFQTDGYDDYFLWGMDGDFGMVALSGEDGTYYIGAEDTDADGMPGELSVTLPSVSVTGYTGVTASVMLAAPGTVYYDDPDYIIFDYQIDGVGSFITLGAFYGHDWANGDATNGTMREDTDLDGFANEFGTELTSTFQTFTYNIDPTATSVVLRVRLLMNSGSEEVAFDNIQLNGNLTSATVDVTMNVDMNYQITLGNFNPLVDFVDIAGGMNGWSGTVMTDIDGDGIYSYTFTGVAIGTTWEYKFRINASTWESLSNRSYTTVAGVNDVSHFFNDDAGPVDVTFTVIDGTQSYLDIELKGTFTNWSLVQMYDDGTNDDAVAGDHTWTVTLSVPGGAHEWGAIENDGSQWGLWLIVGPNMSLTVNTDGTYSGQDSYEIPAPGNIDVTFNVNMNYQITLGNFDPLVDFVNVAGSMNGFGGSAAMDDTDGDGIYSITIGGFSAVAPLNFVEYKFKINGTDWEGIANNRTYTVVDPGPNVVTHWYNDAMPPLPQDIFFSEYIEGSSNNKALEIYNPLSTSVNLDDYKIAQSVNGGGWAFYHNFPVGATIAPGDVWVIITDQTSTTMYDPLNADEVLSYPSVCHHNGDDARAIIKISGSDSTIIDIIGEPNVDPGTGWSVAGVADATANHTLVRKASITQGNTNWAASAGTDATNSEWVVLDQNTFGYLGFHPHTFSTLVDVTFNVNMSYQTTLGNFVPSTDFVDVIGSFNSWASGAVCSDTDGDQIYTIVLTDMAVGDTIFFKFRINGDWNTSEFPGGGPDREYIVAGIGNVADYWYNDDEPVAVATIYDIQYTIDPSGNSPYLGQMVSTSGLVTAIDNGSYFIQDGIGAWNGVYVYDNTNTPAIGDHVSFIADVDEYYNLTELKNVSNFVVNSSGNTLPPITVLSTLDASSMEAYEGVFVQVLSAECNNANAGNGEWVVNDGSGDLLVDDMIFAFTPDSGHVYNITGVMYFGFGALKLLPRDINDIEDITVLGDIQTLSINTGWSIFSTYIIPFLPNLNDVFAPIVTDVRLVKNGNGLVYWPAFSLNAIGPLVIGQGYQINLLAAHNLDIVGTEVVPETTVLSFPQGWSIMGYLRTTPADAAVVLSPISTQIVLCKNGNGQVYWPSYGLNMIGNLMPGQGYQINMVTAQTFTFPANGTLSQTSKTSVIPVHFKNSLNTGCNMTLGIPNSSWRNLPNTSDEIGIFTSNGLLVGSGVYTNGNMAIAIWGSDEFSQSAMLSGEVYNIKLWNHISGEETSITVNSWLRGDEFFAKDGISVISDISVNENIFENYPNPANNFTEIVYSVSSDSYVNLTVFNSLGETVEILVSKNMNEGVYTLNLNTSSYTTGIYFYKLSTNTGVKTNVLQVAR